MSGLGSSCGACKFLRRRCSAECIFAPYFCYEQAPAHFAAVHKVFGASNVSKLLTNLPVQCRSDAALTISYEATARMQDPVYGCVAHIFALQQQVACLKEEIQMIGDQMSGLQEITSIPYFGTESSIHHQQNLQYSWASDGNIESCCSDRDSEKYNEISQALMDSIIMQRLLEELNQDHDQSMHSPWTINAPAPEVEDA